MFKGLLSIVSLFITINASASILFSDVVFDIQNQLVSRSISRGLDWKVGDTNNYNIDMGIAKGTMSMTVASYNNEGIWMHQNVDLGFLGKQQIQTLINPNNGAVIKMIVDGKEQEPPKQELEVIEIVDDNITVPAGTFACHHARLNDKTNNQEVNIWMTTSVPLSGMIKTVQPSQFGKVTIEMTSFVKK